MLHPFLTNQLFWSILVHSVFNSCSTVWPDEFTCVRSLAVLAEPPLTALQVLVLPGASPALPSGEPAPQAAPSTAALLLRDKENKMV